MSKAAEIIRAAAEKLESLNKEQLIRMMECVGMEYVDNSVNECNAGYYFNVTFNEKVSFQTIKNIALVERMSRGFLRRFFHSSTKDSMSESITESAAKLNMPESEDDDWSRFFYARLKEMEMVSLYLISSRNENYKPLIAKSFINEELISGFEVSEHEGDTWRLDSFNHNNLPFSSGSNNYQSVKVGQTNQSWGCENESMPTH